MKLKEFFTSRTIETEGRSLTEIVLEACDQEAQAALEEDPGLMTFCNRCGCLCRLSETDIHGNCC